MVAAADVREGVTQSVGAGSRLFLLFPTEGKRNAVSTHHSPLADDFHTTVVRVLDRSPALSPPATWLASFEQLGVSLGGKQAPIQQFIRAWTRLYSATLLLDHLQDRDELGDAWLAAQTPPLQYHFAFSAYALANDELAALTSTLPPARGVRLQRLWSATVLQLAAGQYRDLTLRASSLGAAGLEALDCYEELAAQKTGAAFALALGGCAGTATDDIALVDAAASAGLIVGMLLQYYDDLLDQASQEAQPEAVTLARAWAVSVGGDKALPLKDIWGIIYARYWNALDAILAALPAPAHLAISTLVQGMFGAPPGASPIPITTTV